MEKKNFKKIIYLRVIKRFLDIIISSISLIVLLPLLLVTSILIRLKLGHPIIFKQIRPGYKENLFKLYKFRSMTDKRDVDGNFLPDSERLTKFGKFLRSTSIDELPELFNILKGDLTLVGPRPQLVKDMVFMSDKHRKRHSVKPGLTGWAQVNGRNNISWAKKLDLDLEYIDQISFKKDLFIILLTFRKVLERVDVNTDGMDTAEDYGDYLLNNKLISSSEYNSKINSSIIIIDRFINN